MTRMYKVDGQWRTYQSLHDSDGYTLTPSIPISYISSNEPTWGEDYGEHGYYTGLADDDDEYDPTQGEYFAVDIFGWYSLNEMSSEVLLMPSNADPTLYFSNGVITCKAAKITLPRDPDLYLLADETQILNGWHTLEWWQEHGWDEAQPVATALFGGDFSGNNISLDSVDGGGSLVSRYNASRELFPNTGWIGGEMIDRHGNSRALFELQGWSPGGVFERPPLKTILGGIITDTSSTSFEVDAVEPMTQGSIEFTGDLLNYTMPSSGGIMAQGSIEFTGDLLAYTMPLSGGIIEEYSPTTNSIEVLLGLSHGGSDWYDVIFSSNDYWFGGITSQADATSIADFGLTVLASVAPQFGPYGSIQYDNTNYTFEPIALYSDSAGTNENVADMSNFYVDDYNGNGIVIKSINAYGTNSKTWKCRITKTT